MQTVREVSIGHNGGDGTERWYGDQGGGTGDDGLGTELAVWGPDRQKYGGLVHRQYGGMVWQRGYGDKPGGTGGDEAAKMMSSVHLLKLLC